METLSKFSVHKQSGVISCEQLNFKASIKGGHMPKPTFVCCTGDRVYVADDMKLCGFDIDGNLIKLTSINEASGTLAENGTVIGRIEVIHNFVVVFSNYEDIVVVLDKNLNLVFKLRILLERVLNFDGRIICAHDGQILEFALTESGTINLSPLNDPRFALTVDGEFANIKFLGKLDFNDDVFENATLNAKMREVFYFTQEHIYTVIDDNVVKQSILDPEDTEVLFTCFDKNKKCLNFPVVSRAL